MIKTIKPWRVDDLGGSLIKSLHYRLLHLPGLYHLSALLFFLPTFSVKETSTTQRVANQANQAPTGPEAQTVLKMMLGNRVE